MDRKNEEQLIRLTKLMLIVVMVLIITTFVQCEKEAKAGLITGEKHLVGMPVYLEQLEEPLYPYEIQLLAEVMYHENWRTDPDKFAAYYTGAVVMNRVKAKRYPNTIHDVLYQKNPRQYSTTDDFFTKELPEECYKLAMKVYRGTPDVPENVVYQAMFKQGSGVWQKINTDYFCFGEVD